MTWLRDLLLGIFTRHLGAKLLALLLSVGLFGSVQTSLTGTQEIPELDLQFTLGEDLKDEFVLLSRKFEFKGLNMTGMRSKVDPLARVYRGDPVVTLTIDQRFLNLYGNKEDGDRVRIPVDPTLFHDDRLFGKDIAVGTLPDVSVVLDPLVTKKEVRVAVSSTVSTALPPGHRFEGKLAISFNVNNVTLKGPASAFVGAAEPTVFVSFDPKVEEQLSHYPIPGEKGTARLLGPVIRWKEGNIAEAFLPFLRIGARELSSEPLDPAEFQRRIEASCDVVKRKARLQITVPIEIRYPVPRKYDLVEDWDLFPQSGTFTASDLKAGLTQGLDVSLPASLKDDKDFLSNLALVLDVARAEESAEALKVPFYLDLKDRGREGDRASLAEVDIMVKDRVAEFRKEPK